MEMNGIEWMWLAIGMYVAELVCLMTSDSQRTANCGYSKWAEEEDGTGRPEGK